VNLAEAKALAVAFASMWAFVPEASGGFKLALTRISLALCENARLTAVPKCVAHVVVLA
jgi:hypothetical protein